MVKFYTTFIVVFLGTIWELQAQVITVIDQVTQVPIENVSVYPVDKSFISTTNSAGQTSISSWPEDSYLIISHSSYEEYVVSTNQLKTLNFRIKLPRKTITINEVVIAANRWEQEKKETPNRILSIGSKELTLNNPQTTADILFNSGQVFVQKSQLGGGSPMIRGFAANSVLIVVDGVRMNNAIFRSGNLQNIISIDPFSLERTEVLFGPASVMYGSDALGGIMHFKTRDPEFKSGDVSSLKLNTVMRYSSANNEKTGHLDLELPGKKFSLLSSITYSDFDHLVTGNKRTKKFPDYGKRFQFVQRVNQQDQVIDNSDYNNQVFSGYRQLNLMNKVAMLLGKSADLTYTLNYSTTSDIPRYDRLIETDRDGNFKSAEWYYGPQQWLSNSLKLNYYRPTKLFDAARVILALQNLEESRHDRNFDAVWLRNRQENVDLTTLNIDLEKDLGTKNRLFYGIEGFFNKVKSQGNRENIDNGETNPIISRYPNNGSDYYSIAAYVSNKWQPGGHVALTTGIRYNLVRLDARYQDQSITNPPNQLKIDNSAFNGNIGLAWTPGESWQINTLFSTGFRAPNVDDIAKIFDGTNGIVTVPNTELEPEYSYNFEAGLTKTFEGKLKISGTMYYTLLQNMMVQQNYNFHGTDSIYLDGESSRIQALVNGGSAKIYGGSAQLEWAVATGLVARSSFTITQGKDSKDQPLRHTTPNFGFVGMTFQKGKFTGELNYRFSGKREFEDMPKVEQQKTHLYTSDGALAWQTLNFTGAYTLSKNFGFTLGVENILNHHYRPYSSGISAAGRNYIISLSASF